MYFRRKPVGPQPDTSKAALVVASRSRFPALTAIAVALLISVASFATPSRSMAQDDVPSSLDIVPATASFYYASMNHLAQLDAIMESNAYQQILTTDVGKRMRKAYRSGKRDGWGQFGWNNPFANYLQGYHESMGSVPGKMALPYIKQILGSELFIYGDEDWLAMSEGVGAVFERLSSSMQEMDVQNMTTEDIQSLLKIAREELTGINTPTLVIGAVLDRPGGVESLLQMGEALIEQGLDRMPGDMSYITDGYEVIEEDDLYILTFQLESDNLPWDELANDPSFAPLLDDLKALLSDKSVNVSVGIKDHFLLLSLGPDNTHLRQLGKGELMIDLPKAAALKTAAASHKMITACYVSEATAKNRAEGVPRMIDSIVQVAETILDASRDDVEESGIDVDELISDLKKDAGDMKNDIVACMPKPGAYVGFSYFFEGGIEGFTYDWSENNALDGSKPLELLSHVGEKPFIVAASHAQSSKDNVKTARRWLGRLFDYVEKYGPVTAPGEDEAAMVKDILSDLRPILSRIGDTTIENVVEATDSQETAFVIDFSVARNRWHPEMPRSNQKLPVPGMAMIFQHTDREKLVQAGKDYLEAGNDIVDIIRAIPDTDVPPEFKLTPPRSKSMGDGDVFYYALPPEAGLDSSIAPHVYLSDDTMIAGILIDQTENLISAKRPDYQGLLADSSKPMMSAFYYDNVQLIEALDAWAMYAMQLAKEDGADIAVGQGAESDLLEFGEDELMEAYEHVVTLLKCFKSASSTSYMEDGAQVTRYQMLFEDVAER